MPETLTPTIDTCSNDELMRRLAHARQRSTLAAHNMTTLLEEIKQTQLYRGAEAMRKDAEEQARLLDAEIRRRAVAAFDGKNKKPWHGVSIKMKVNVTCTDEAAASEYAVKNVPELIRLDMTEFSRLAKKLHGTPHALPFFQIKDEPSADIAADLSGYLVTETEVVAVELGEPLTQKEIDGIPF
jgi:hypothetical protein